MSTKKMNNKGQGVLAAVLIAFFILVAIAVTTPALSNMTLQTQDQEEIIIENETASNNTTAMNNTGNNTE